MSHSLNHERSVSTQPVKIIPSLKQHQLACLFKAKKIEQDEYIEYKNNDTNIKVSTCVGLLGDLVGYGKTLTALGIIAQNPISEIHTNSQLTHSYNSTDTFHNKCYTNNNMTITKNVVNSPNLDDFIETTLVIVPRGPVYTQWVTTINEKTTLKCLAIDNVRSIRTKMPPRTNMTKAEIKSYFEKYDLVIIKNTNLNDLITYYVGIDTGPPNTAEPDSNSPSYYSNKCIIKRWARIMIDETHEICNTIKPLSYKFIWLISGTFGLIASRITRFHDRITHNIKDIILNEIDYILIKCTNEFVRESFKIPDMREYTYQCKLSPTYNVIRNLLNERALEKLNASDLHGVIRELGGTNVETEEHMVERVTNNLKKLIHNKKQEYTYIESLEIEANEKQNRLNNILKDINSNESKLENLLLRIKELSKKTCAICMDILENPIILECAHIYCGGCLMNWISKYRLSNNATCPECRNIIKQENLINITLKRDDVIESRDHIMKSKEDTLINIINKNRNGKYLVFSRIDNGFAYIKRALDKANIDFAKLKGTTSTMSSVLSKFKSGELNVILLSTKYAGSGIDISYATDIIIYHKMGEDKIQAVGRGQRVGRTSPLSVHNLLYEHEMSNS